MGGLLSAFAAAGYSAEETLDIALGALAQQAARRRAETLAGQHLPPTFEES